MKNKIHQHLRTCPSKWFIVASFASIVEKDQHLANWVLWWPTAVLWATGWGSYIGVKLMNGYWQWIILQSIFIAHVLCSRTILGAGEYIKINIKKLTGKVSINDFNVMKTAVAALVYTWTSWHGPTAKYWKTVEVTSLQESEKRGYSQMKRLILDFSSAQFSSVSQLCPTLQHHELQHARPPCPSPTPRVHPNPCLLCQWCHPTISSSVIPFSSCPQSFPASGSFQMSQPSAWGGQSIRVSASTSGLPMNTQDWSPLGWTGWISLQSKGFSSLLQHHSSKASILQWSAFFIVQLSHPSPGVKWC